MTETPDWFWLNPALTHHPEPFSALSFLTFTGPTFLRLGPFSINCDTHEISVDDNVPEPSRALATALVDAFPRLIAERLAAAREEGRQAGLREAAAKIDGMVRWTIGIEEPGDTP